MQLQVLDMLQLLLSSGGQQGQKVSELRKTLRSQSSRGVQAKPNEQPRQHMFQATDLIKVALRQQRRKQQKDESKVRSQEPSQ